MRNRTQHLVENQDFNIQKPVLDGNNNWKNIFYCLRDVYFVEINLQVKIRLIIIKCINVTEILFYDYL